MPITTEFDWLTCVDPCGLTQLRSGSLDPQRFRWLAVSWGERIRHFY